jgi:hypothetical protein
VCHQPKSVVKFQKNRHSKGFKLPKIEPIAQGIRAKKWSDSIGRALDSVHTWNGGVAREEACLCNVESHVTQG